MIQVENLAFQYPKSDKQTLKGLNFEISKGEIFGFLGPSGAGKSTTQKILYKILSGYKGSVFIDGKNITDWGSSYLEKIGVGFELPNHYLKLTGKENMDLFASFYKNNRSINNVELFEMFDLQDAMNKPVDAYSKGMKIRLNFIRAIQHNPDILFFDEPTSGLDPVNAHKIKQHILDLKSQGKTIFITTHSMDTADQLCDRVSFIVDGNLQATDTPKNLKNKYGKDAVKVELQNGNTKEFMLNDLGKNITFLNFIQQDEVKKIHTLEATLEEVFIKITGKKLSI
jgi:fluoroquinolone transport system ATP-binding protein